MKRFKKKTIALVFASVIAMASAFGAEGYKNTLKALSFSGMGASSSVKIYTQENFDGDLTIHRKMEGEYELILPDTASGLVRTPSYTNDIISVDISTIPYSETEKGYTKVTIKTQPYVHLSASTSLYQEESPLGYTVISNEREDSPIESTEEEEYYEETVDTDSESSVSPTREDLSKKQAELLKTENEYMDEEEASSETSSNIDDDIYEEDMEDGNKAKVIGKKLFSSVKNIVDVND